MLIRSIFLVSLFLFLQACVSATTQEYERQLSNKLIGKDIKLVSDTLGYHTKTMTAINGNKVYVYESAQSGNTSVSCSTDINGKTSCSGGGSYHFWCKKFFEVDKSNRIVRVDLQGNNCPRACSDGYELLAINTAYCVKKSKTKH